MFTVGDMKASVAEWMSHTALCMPKRRPAGVFTPPTPEEVAAYGASIDYPLNGDDFCDSYEAKGWVVGKTKMRSWQAAVRNWKCNGWGKLLNQPKSQTDNETYDSI